MRRAAFVVGVAISWLSISLLAITTAISADLSDAPSMAAAAPVVSLKPETYTIGGTVIGLKYPGTVRILDKSDSDNESVSDNGTFKLPRAVKSGTAFDVTVGKKPTGQSCAVQNGSGTVVNANITNVLVYCTYIQSVATLNGSYDGAGYNINHNTDLLSIGVAFDGAGHEGNTATLIENLGGTITTTSNSSSSAGPYTVKTKNAIPILTTGGNNIGAIAGEDADEFFWIADASTKDGGGLPALAVGVNSLQNGTIAALAGNWFTVGMSQGSDPNDFEGVLTINADGSFSSTLTSLDVNYVVTSYAQSGTLTVTSGGQYSDGGDSLGYFSANGEFLVVAKTGSGTTPGQTVAVKQGTGVTLATLNGVYTLGSLSFSTATTGDGEVSTLFFDGAGNFSGTYIDNNNGTITSGNTISGTYSVTSTGALTFTTNPGNEHTGGVSADGNIIVAANLTAGGAEQPRIFVGFRQ